VLAYSLLAPDTLSEALELRPINPVDADLGDRPHGGAGPITLVGPGDCDGLARFDGVTWTRYLRDACIYAVDTAADPTLWVQAGEWLRTSDEDQVPLPGAVHTYVITAEAVAATE